MGDRPLEVLSEAQAIKTADGMADATLHRPATGGPYPAAILFMDALGYRPALNAMAQRLAASGYGVLLPNLFYREGPGRPFDFVRERDHVMGLIRALTPARVASDTRAYVAFLDDVAGVSTARMGVHGYCMGGGCALIAAATVPDKIAAAAAFHAGRLVTDAPDSPHKQFSKIKARVYCGVAGIDPFLAPDETATVEKTLAAAKVRHTVEIYDGVQHGFAVTDTPVYDEAAAERHWARLLALYRETLS